MQNVLACVDSTLAPSAVLQAVRELYGARPSATCELVQHHLDATYLLSDAADSRIVRVFNARWWTGAEVAAELAVLRHLSERGLRVAAAVPRRDGALQSAVQAPEGERQLVVYEYLDGQALVPSRDAQQLGAAVGSMHRALEDHTLLHARRELTVQGFLTDSFDATLAQLGERDEPRQYLEGLRARVLERAESLGLAAFRHGICHGDLNFSNALRQADGQLALFDFESCGFGILAYDLAVFRWNQWLFQAQQQIWLDFVAGYRRTNELPERELAGIDLLVLLRQAFMLGHDARRTQIESLGTRWRRVRRTQKLDALRQLDAEVFGTPVEQGW
jgi:Ser/Thr protein kinase RdoA (MazF antagonist)